MMTPTHWRVVPAVAAVLATISSIAVATHTFGPAVAAGFPLEVGSTSGQLVDGVVVVAPGDTVSVTFTNVGGTEVQLDDVSFPFELPYLPSGNPIASALVSIGVDPATVVHETASIQTNVDTCSTLAIPVGDSCTVEIELLPQGLGTLRPFGSGIRLVDTHTLDVLGETFVIWPPAPTPRPTNDDFVNAEDLSSLPIPAYQEPLVTASAGGDTTGSTVEPGEYGTAAGDANQRSATVWYRYTSPPGGFAGLLGYQVSAGFRVEALGASDPDPLNPGSRVPAESPTTVDALWPAAGNDVVPGPTMRFVRMEPGHTVWFQVWADGWSGDGPFTIELFQAPNPQDDVVLAHDVWNGSPFPDNSGWGGDGTTYHITPDVPGGQPTAWATHVFDRSGRLTVRVASQTPLASPSTVPVTLELYRAPSTAVVSDASQLGAPIATATGGLTASWSVVGGSGTLVDGWVADLRDVPVQPGRYYIGVARSGTASTFYGISDQFHADSPPPPPPTDTTPPTVTITGAPTGTTASASATLTAVANEPIRSMTCTLTLTTPTGDLDTFPIDCSTITGGTTVSIPLSGLPDGEVSVSVTATDLAGNVGSAFVVWHVQQPPTVVITSPADGAQLVAAEVPTLTYTCTDNGTIGGEEILVDGGPGTATLPSAPGDHTVVVRCTDLSGNTGSATVTYTVIAALVVPDLETTTDEDIPRSVDLLTGVSAGPGASLTVVAVGTPQHGTVSAPAPTVTYTPATDYFGPDQFTYTVSDGTTSATATVTVRVVAVNDLPVAVDDSLAVTAGQTMAVDLLANDTDVDGDTLQIVSVSRVAGSPSLGTLTCPAAGACSYQVPATAPGGVETWTYRITDGLGDADGQLTVTVTPLPPPPPAGDHLTISLGGAISLTAGGPITSGDITIIPPGTAGGGRIVGAGTVGTTTVSFNLVRPRNAPWFGTIRVYDASRGVDLWVPVFGATVRIAPDGTYSATVTWFVVSRTAPFIRPVTLTFSVRDGG